MKKILVCGHRGFPAKFPQNTLVSFAGAIAVGCDRIEYDLHWTSDRKLVVCHNDTVDSTSNGTGKIADMTFGEIRKLDFGRWKDERFAGTPIPEFREVLELTNKLAPQLFHLVELKVDSIDYAEDVLEELSRHKMAGRFTLVSFHLELLREIKKRHPEVLIHGNPSTRLQEFDYEEYRIFDSVGLHRNNVTASVVAGFHSVGTAVDAWTVDTPEEFRKQAANNVDSVTSNDPGTLLAERDKPSI